MFQQNCCSFPLRNITKPLRIGLFRSKASCKIRLTWSSGKLAPSPDFASGCRLSQRAATKMSVTLWVILDKKGARLVASLVLHCEFLVVPTYEFLSLMS